jgi:aspartate/methionine/tyrosine aminotransferase
MNLETLTEYEKLAKFQVLNLSDGHARQFQSEHTPIAEAEDNFKTEFFHLAGQTSKISKDNSSQTLICHSASSACEIIANYLRLKSLRVALLEPTFDNIPNILRRHGIPLIPLKENFLMHFSDSISEQNLEFDVIFIVCPNNPTGATFNRKIWENIANYCKKYEKLMIVDVAFRFFSSEMFWDQYEMLDKIGVDYILIEDTGKTWPTLDLKVGLLNSSKKIYPTIDKIHDDYLLNVSPFILNLISEYIEQTRRDGIDQSIWSLSQSNRKTLYDAIGGTFLRPLCQSEIMSVAWLEIDDSVTLSGEDIYDKLIQENVHVLPGTHFYWNSPEQGKRCIRVALSRPQELFDIAAASIRKVLTD